MKYPAINGAKVANDINAKTTETKVEISPAIFISEKNAERKRD